MLIVTDIKCMCTFADTLYREEEGVNELQNEKEKRSGSQKKKSELIIQRNNFMPLPKENKGTLLFMTLQFPTILGVH